MQSTVIVQQPPPPPQYVQPVFITTQQPPPQQTVIVQQQPARVVTTQFRDNPVRMNCPACQADIMTSVSYHAGIQTWVICFILCLVGLGWGCCIIPFFIDSCKDIVHTCPNCNNKCGQYTRM